MRDLWKELARRARDASQPAAEEMPFGFDDAVLRKFAGQPRERAGIWDAWVPLLRPAVGLAFGTAMLCVLLQFRADQKLPNNLVTQTETLLQYAILNE